MKQNEKPKNPQPDPIRIQALIWRAADKRAAGKPQGSDEREAEYRARKQLRAVVDQSGGA